MNTAAEKLNICNKRYQLFQLDKPTGEVEGRVKNLLDRLSRLEKTTAEKKEMLPSNGRRYMSVSKELERLSVEVEKLMADLKELRTQYCNPK